MLLLERKQLTCGTTWHAAGLLTTLRDTVTQTRLAKYTQDLYRRLEAETGQATGVISCGSIQLAATPDKAEEMRRGVNIARCFGVDGHEISPQDVKAIWPLADVPIWPQHSISRTTRRANPADVTQALAKGARMRGGATFENTPVTRDPRSSTGASAAWRPSAGDDRGRNRGQLRRHVGAAGRARWRASMCRCRRPSTTT